MAGKDSVGQVVLLTVKEKRGGKKTHLKAAVALKTKIKGMFLGGDSESTVRCPTLMNNTLSLSLNCTL